MEMKKYFYEGKIKSFILEFDVPIRHLMKILNGQLDI